MSWERFTNIGRSVSPRVSIRGKVQIGLNTAAIIEFKLKDFRYTVLFFDNTNKRIGIKLTNDQSEEGACKLRVRDDKKGAHISAKSYIKKYNLGDLSIKSFEASYDKESNMIVANVK
jgi:hypothetical protein